MDHPIEMSRLWFKDPRLLIAGAVAAAAIALAGAAVGIASARTDRPTARPTGSTGELSVVMTPPREANTPAPVGDRMATLDPISLRNQATSPISSDPEGDENLRVVDAQERRLQAMNDREAAAFAAQMRQTEHDDGVMAREVRATNDEAPTRQSSLSTSNTTGTD